MLGWRGQPAAPGRRVDALRGRSPTAAGNRRTEGHPERDYPAGLLRGRTTDIQQDRAEARLVTFAAYYDELSFGKLKFQGAAFGPYTVAKPTDCRVGTIEALARQAARNAGVAIEEYYPVAVTIPPNSGLDCACSADTGRSPASSSPYIAEYARLMCTDPNALTHETGHNLGLAHASTASCGGVPYKRDGYKNCQVQEYGNHYNTMGSGLGHMNAFQKTTMKWLDGCNNMLVTKDGTFDVYPIEVGAASTQSLQIPNGERWTGHDIFYWVEFRNPALAKFVVGEFSPPERGPGVHISVAPDFRDTGGDLRSLLLDLAPGSPGTFDDPRLTAGRSFVDPDERVTISPVDNRREGHDSSDIPQWG